MGKLPDVLDACCCPSEDSERGIIPGRVGDAAREVEGD